MWAQGVSSLLWFVVIIAAIPLALWLLKRSPAGARFSGGNQASGAMRSISTLPISGTQRLLTVEVGHGEDRCWLVLGVTANSITTLHTMAPQADAPSMPATPFSAAPPFAQLLGRFRRDQEERP